MALSITPHSHTAHIQKPSHLMAYGPQPLMLYAMAMGRAMQKSKEFVSQEIQATADGRSLDLYM